MLPLTSPTISMKTKINLLPTGSPYIPKPGDVFVPTGRGHKSGEPLLCIHPARGAKAFSHSSGDDAVYSVELSTGDFFWSPISDDVKFISLQPAGLGDKPLVFERKA